MDAPSFRAREPNWEQLEDSSGAVGVPVVLPKPVTSPKAFAFKSEARLEQRRAAKQRQNEQTNECIHAHKNLQRQRRKPLSTHCPNRTISAEPKLTTPASPQLSVNKLRPTRAQQRAERAERRAKEAELKARLKREKEEQAEQEIAEAYEKNRFRFKPPSTKSRIVEIQPSNTALTVPKTPQFAKAKSRMDDTQEGADQARENVDEAREEAPGTLQGLQRPPARVLREVA